MLKVNAYSAKGVKVKAVVLPKKFEAKGGERLLSQAIHVYRAEAHPGLSKAKTRSEINRTKKKWYKQKGTGGARHGARSAHIFVGGGVAHGPTGLKRPLSLPKKARELALKIAISAKVKEGKVAVVSFEKIKKTKEASILLTKILKNLGVTPEAKLLVALSPATKGVKRVMRNIENVMVVDFENLNAYDIFFSRALFIDKEII